jgi:hypothetical protein
VREQLKVAENAPLIEEKPSDDPEIVRWQAASAPQDSLVALRNKLNNRSFDL